MLSRQINCPISYQGQKQRVAIARALANDPEIILADEPTGSLDKSSAEAVFNILKEIANSGKLVICVTHSQKVASKCSRIVRLDDGKIAEDTKLKEVNKKIPRAKQIKPKSIGNKELFKLAGKNISQNRNRSILVSIAMSIGIAAVVFMFCLSAGIKNYVTSDTDTLMNKLQIDVAKDSNAVSSFTDTDINMIEVIGGVDYVEKGATVSLSAQYKKQSESDSKYTTLLTLSSTYESFAPSIDSGELPEEGEILISKSMAVRLNLTEESVLTLKLNGNTEDFTVSGVYTIDSSFDTACIVYDDMTKLNGNEIDYNKLYVFAESVNDIEAIMTDITAMEFSAYREDSAIEDLLSYVDIGTAVLTSVAAISLFVSAIMIFIVLYISVVERTKEIGVLRAIGARRKDIRKMFVMEAGIFGFAAGVIGCLISLLLGVVTNSTLASS